MVLAETVPEDFTPARVSDAYRRLALRYGMPIDWHERVRVAPSIHACRAVVATRLRWPDREAAIANLAPELARRLDPVSVEEVLTWAGIPLATAEVAAVCDREPPDVRGELARVASFQPVGVDGYWSV